MDISQLPFPFSFFTKYFWLLALLATFYNATYLKKKSKRYIESDSSLEEGYEKLYRGYLFYMSLPWAVMGIGVIFGNVQSMFDFFSVRSTNPFVWLFLITLVILWMFDFVWITFRGGAEFLVKHPGVISPTIKSPFVIKIFNLLTLACGVGALIFFSNMQW
jgi:hypothetical protein